VYFVLNAAGALQIKSRSLLQAQVIIIHRLFACGWAALSHVLGPFAGAPFG